MAKTAARFEYAGFWRRVGATIIDTVILILISTVIQISFGQSIGSTQINPLITLVRFVLVIGYYLLFWVNYDGATPGKRLLGIRIVRTSGKPITYATAIVRYIGYLLSGIVLCLGFLWMLIDRKRQTWHDKMADTVVIKTGVKVNSGLVFIIIFFGLLFYIGYYVYIYKSVSTVTNLAVSACQSDYTAKTKVETDPTMKNKLINDFAVCLRQSGVSSVVIDAAITQLQHQEQEMNPVSPSPIDLITPAPLTPEDLKK